MGRGEAEVGMQWSSQPGFSWRQLRLLSALDYLPPSSPTPGIVDYAFSISCCHFSSCVCVCCFSYLLVSLEEYGGLGRRVMVGSGVLEGK